MYELYNTATEEVLTHEAIGDDEAERRNNILRQNDEPHRWIPCRCGEEQ